MMYQCSERRAGEMDKLSMLQSFFDGPIRNPVVGTGHIALFCAIVNLTEPGKKEAKFWRRELMALAKIFGKTTFSNCIMDLDKLGCIEYLPSRNHRCKSIAIVKLGSENVRLDECRNRNERRFADLPHAVIG